MAEMFEYSFMQHALIAAVLVSLLCGIVGALVVVNRMVFLAGGIAHAAYGGVGLSLFLAWPIFLPTALVAAVSALVMAHLTLYRRESSDVLIGAIWAVGMAAGIILVDLTPGYQADMMSYLFGSLLAVSRDDLVVMAVLLGALVLFVSLFYDQILAVSYDSEFALLQGIATKRYYTLILLFCALGVVVAMKVVGLILVIAMLTIPLYIAEKLSASLWQMMLYGSLLSLLFTLGGLSLSYLYDLSSGASIILVSSAGMLLFWVVRELRR